MALRPETDKTEDDKRSVRKAAEQDVLLREVDEAVRKDQLDNFGKRYGIPIGIAVVLGLALFGGWLFWQDRREGALEERSEQLVTTLDDLEAGRLEPAKASLATIADGDTATAVSAKLALAGLALSENRRDEGVKIYEGIVADAAAPQPHRDLALVRAVAANFEQMEPQQVVDRLKALAVPGNPWFGSAGELVGMAYLKQGKEDLAGPLFAEIAKDEAVPQSLRSRARQMAGLLGADAVVDVDQTLSEMRTDQGASPAVAGQ